MTRMDGQICGGNKDNKGGGGKGDGRKGDGSNGGDDEGDGSKDGSEINGKEIDLSESLDPKGSNVSGLNTSEGIVTPIFIFSSKY